MKKGFTLVELLAVIVILAVILAIAVPGISSIINSTTKESFSSNSKLVLKAIDYKLMNDSSYDITSINETNIKSVLNIDDSNYKKVTVKKENNVPYIILVGKNKWNNLVASGTSTDIQVQEGLLVWLDAGNTSSYPGTGTTWYDLSSNGNDATINGNINNPTWNSNGYWEFKATAIGLDGGMIIQNSTSLQSASSMTVELVFTMQSKTLVSGDTDWMCLFSKTTASSSQTPAVSINQGSTGARYFHVERPALFNSANNLFTDFTGNKWYYTAATFDSTSYGYLNATQVSTSAGGITANNYPIYIGLDLDNEMFKGKLAIVRVYNRALSLQEIQQNYNNIKDKFGL